MLVKAKNTRNNTIVYIPEGWLGHPTLGKDFKDLTEKQKKDAVVTDTANATMKKEVGTKNA